MRFMMLMYPGKGAEAGQMPSQELMGAMMKYNEELTKAGILLALDGLHPSAKGARVHFNGGKPKVVDGPFTELKEVLGGYWMIQVKSKEEAVEWATRAPCPAGETIEVRRVFEMSDFNIDPAGELNAAAERVGGALGKADRKP
jgi:hypothetical protein